MTRATVESLTILVMLIALGAMAIVFVIHCW
jgi:hypothetical protein